MKRRNGSELAQVVIVHAAMLTSAAAIILLINAIASTSHANVSRAVASIANSTQTITVQSLDELPSCAVLKASGVEWIESNEQDEWSYEDLCE